jgi:hypothetical protein
MYLCVCIYIYIHTCMHTYICLNSQTCVFSKHAVATCHSNTRGFWLTYVYIPTHLQASLYLCVFVTCFLNQTLDDECCSVVNRHFCECNGVKVWRLLPLLLLLGFWMPQLSYLHHEKGRMCLHQALLIGIISKRVIIYGYWRCICIARKRIRDSG